MNYNRKIMRLELSAENPVHGGYYYAELLLPAADYEIKDAMQRTRAVGRENTVEVSILECDILPEMQDIRLDTVIISMTIFRAKPTILSHKKQAAFRAAIFNLHNFCSDVLRKWKDGVVRKRVKLLIFWGQ